MFSKLQDRLGTAGIVIGIIALVAALGGTAFAAAGLTGKQQKEVKSIAKHYAGKPGKPGKDGQNGTNGLPGAKGDTGAQGTQGTQGIQGIQGKPGEPGEPGEPGSPWTAGGTLPSEKTETGSFRFEAGAIDFTSISFPIPLPSEISAGNVKSIKAGGTPPAECDDGVAPSPSPAHPEADPGFLCIFIANGTVKEGLVTAYNPASGSPGGGASSAGAILVAEEPEGPLGVIGTFAVTAP